MGGLIVLAILIGWGWLVKILVGLLAAKARKKYLQVCIYIIGFPLLFMSPVLDEVIAIPQVNKICREGTLVHIDAEKIKNKEVWLEIRPSWKSIEGTVIPIEYSHYSFRSVEDNKELANYNVYRIAGGWLVRLINFNGINSPIIGWSYCDIGMSDGAFAKKNEFYLVDKN